MAVRRLTGQTVLGGAIVLLGLLLLVNTTGVADTSALLVYVPSLFVLVGVYALVRSRFHNLFGPVLVVVVAGAAQVVALGWVAADDLVALWPLLVVLFGVSVLAGRMRARATASDDAYVDAFALFGGVDRRATGDTFTGATLTAVFGGTELDLRDVRLAERPARVSATALFGGAEVVVPRDWRVEVDVVPLFGVAEDERPRRADEHETVDLVLTGFTAFGGVSVSD
ncbi:LiaF transmembrane domain-containing protein [Halomarina rubra]|uniref:LiaF domain-containing protein n=1 Tax=Halomarina rubra TaxID=2071873 RepID=A0ABD6ASH4_9EURY|nr:LiaF domain-containing protein [Halomarina rubra]